MTEPMDRIEYREAFSKEYDERFYGQLNGAKIIKFVGMRDSDPSILDNGFPTFQVELADGTITELEITIDEEGNGGGTLFGLEEVSMADFVEKHGKPWWWA